MERVLLGGGGRAGGKGVKPDRDAEVREEIRFHLQERARELEAEGLPPEEARRRAREAFGDPERVAARVLSTHRRHDRDEGRTRMLDAWAKDLALAARGLRRRPGFTAVVVATLALAIGAVTAVFGVVDASVLRGPPFADAGRLVFLQGAYAAPEGPRVRGASPAEARDWGAMSRSFEGVAAYDGVTLTLTGGEGPAERVDGETVGQGYLHLLRVEPLVGRGFTADEHAPGTGERAALVGEGLWTRRWGRDPSVVGRTVELDGRAYTVVGVLPASFRGMSLTADVWVPLASTLSADDMDERGNRWLSAVARLRPGVTVEEARTDMEGVAARLEAAHPDVNQDRVALVTPLRDVYLGSTRTLLLVVLGATALLLLIAAANVANLLLVRAWARGPEILMRRALGAGRGALARQFLAESALLSLAGAAAGLLLGVWGGRLLAGAMPEGFLPAYVDVRPDVGVFALAVGLMAAVAAVTGVLPALLGGRADVAGGLRERSAGGAALGGRRIQGSLVAGEVALALLLLVGAGLMVRSLRAQLAVDPGFDASHLLAFRVELPGERYPDADARRAAADRLLALLQAEPGVKQATLGADAPLRGGSSAAYLWTGEGGGVDDRIRFYFHRVEPGWFGTTGVRLVAGRAIDPSDAEGGFEVGVISRAMARRQFGDTDPVGRTLIVGRPDGLHVRIVGVAEDVRWRDLTTDLVAGATDPDVYLPWPLLPSATLEVVLRSDGDPGTLAGTVRRVVRGFDPELVPSDVTPMARTIRTQTAQGRFGSLLLGAFSALAALLAAVGLYGVLSYAVGRRTREIAVRMALGADAGAVRRMVVLDGVKVAALGLVAGLVVAYFASRSLASFLFQVRPTDPATYAAVATLLLAVAALAAWLPARRATRVDPQRALTES